MGLLRDALHQPLLLAVLAVVEDAERAATPRENSRVAERQVVEVLSQVIFFWAAIGTGPGPLGGAGPLAGLGG